MKIFNWFFTFILISISISNSKAAIITLRSDIWCPYTCNPKSDKPGFMIEIAQEVFKKKGHTIQYGVTTWPRALSDVRSGKYDGLVGCSRVEVDDFAVPETATGTLINYFWTKADSTWTYKNKDSLAGKKFGIVNDYVYGNEVDNLVKEDNQSFKKVAGEYPLYRLIRMAEEKRIDGFVENPIVLKYTLKELKKSDKTFRIASSNIANDPDLHIAFAPNKPHSREYAKILNEGMIELRKNGRLKEILAKYGLTDWK